MNLAKDLLQNKMTSVRTIHKNKTCVPKEFLPNRSRLGISSLFGFQKNCTLVSYVSKKRLIRKLLKNKLILNSNLIIYNYYYEI